MVVLLGPVSPLLRPLLTSAELLLREESLEIKYRPCIKAILM